MKLTKREKILLYFLGCFVLVMVGAFLLAMPAMDGKNEAEAQLQAVQSKLTSLQNTITQYGDLDSAIEEKKKEIAEIKDKFYSPMPNEDVDRLVKTIVMQNNMTLYSMDISSQENYPLTAFQAQGTSAEAIEGEEATSTNLTLVTVTVSFSGDLANLSNLVDQVAGLEAYQAGSLTYNVEDVEDPITMTFKIFVL